MTVHVRLACEYDWDSDPLFPRSYYSTVKSTTVLLKAQLLSFEATQIKDCKDQHLYTINAVILPSTDQDQKAQKDQKSKTVVSYAVIDKPGIAPNFSPADRGVPNTLAWYEIDLANRKIKLTRRSDDEWLDRDPSSSCAMKKSSSKKPVLTFFSSFFPEQSTARAPCQVSLVNSSLMSILD